VKLKNLGLGVASPAGGSLPRYVIRLSIDVFRHGAMKASSFHQTAKPAHISLVINIYFLFCRTNSVRDLIFV
jgi:hypothetical protein